MPRDMSMENLVRRLEDNAILAIEWIDNNNMKLNEGKIYMKNIQNLVLINCRRRFGRFSTTFSKTYIHPFILVPIIPIFGPKKDPEYSFCYMIGRKPSEMI